MKTRKERDSMGEVEVPHERYWGAQTERSRRNFTIGGEGLGKELAKVGPERIQVLDLEVRTSLIDYLRKTWPAPAGR